MPLRMPLLKKRTALLRKLKAVFRRYLSQPVRGERVTGQSRPLTIEVARKSRGDGELEVAIPAAGANGNGYGSRTRVWVKVLNGRGGEMSAISGVVEFGSGHTLTRSGPI